MRVIINVIDEDEITSGDIIKHEWKRTQLRYSVMIALCIKKRTARMKGAEIAKGYLVNNRKIVRHIVYYIYQKNF